MLNCGMRYLFLLAFLACSVPKVFESSRVPATSDPAVIKMSMTDTEGNSGHCTAWKVGANLVATAGHCCEVGNVYGAIGSHAVKASVFTLLVDDDEHDVCILRGVIAGNVINLATTSPGIGEVVWTAGYPRGSFLISDGYWSGNDENGGICSVNVNPGASGSPVMNMRGEAVGILVRYMPGMDNLAYVTTLESVHAAVKLALTK